MNYKELLYNKDNVLSIYPELAVVLNAYDEIKFSSQSNNDKKKKPDRSGLNKAIVINQINYWNGKNENKNRNFFDGHFWSYNSYAGWSKTNFPFWSPTTVKRIFNSLENDGIIISCKNNRLKIDNTKWYRINYERLQEIIDIVEKYRSETNAKDVENHDNCHNDHTSGHNDQTTGSECTDKEVRVTRPLPENNNREYSSEIKDINAFNSKESNANNIINAFNSSQKERAPFLDMENCTFDEVKNHYAIRCRNIAKKHSIGNEKIIDDVSNMIAYFCQEYFKTFGEHHPVLSDRSLERVFVKFYYPPDLLEDYDIYAYEDYKDLIDKYFDTEYGKYQISGIVTDYSLSHFMSDEIRTNLLKNKFNIPY